MALEKNAPLKPGHRLRRYKIVRKLSSGGFGLVYLAERDDGHLVALKEFLPSMMSCRVSGSGAQVRPKGDQDNHRFQEGLSSFFREADILAQVHNPRIIPIWDVFRENGTAYFAMPVEKGGTLQSIIKMRPERITESTLRHIFVEACRGLECLHQKGLMHLDVKPSNLWVRPDRSVVLLDLGASRWEDESLKTAQLARTPGFAAPEQHSIYRDLGIGVRTDVYGMCASILSCLLVKPPPAATERRPMDKPFSELYFGQFPSPLLSLIDRGMDLNPSLRQADVAALRSDLERLPRLNDSNFRSPLSGLDPFTV